MTSSPAGGPCKRDGLGDAAYTEVQAVFRAGTADVRAWTVEVDPDVPIAELRDDLVDALGIGRPADFELRREGSLNEPVLVLRRAAAAQLGC